MKKVLLGITLLFAYSLQAQRTDSLNGPIVHTTYGDIRGISDGEIASFKGIPYAAPPVGEYRWRPPQPVKAWTGVRDGTRQCASCPQRTWPGSTETTSEDCLF
jgi:para-nitrobenzyl esterase